MKITVGVHLGRSLLAVIRIRQVTGLQRLLYSCYCSGPLFLSWNRKVPRVTVLDNLPTVMYGCERASHCAKQVF